MAKNKVEIDVNVDDKGTTKKVALGAKQAGAGLDQTARAAQQADRNLKGAAQASANGTKNFAKMAQGIGGSLVPAYATLAANIFAVTAAFNAFRRAAQVEQLEKSLVRTGNIGGQNLRRLANELKGITGAAIDTEQALRTVATGVTQGFSGSQLIDLTTIAKGASISLGRELPDALDRLVRGTAKLEPEILDELGIIVRLDEASRTYANSLGKTVTQLTQFEKQQAFANAVTEQGLRKFGEVAKNIEANPYDQLAASFGDLQKAVFKASEAFIPLIDVLASRPTALIGVLAMLGGTIISQLAPALSEMATKSASSFKELERSAKKAALKIENDYTKALKGLRTSDVSPKGFKALEASIRAGTASTTQLSKALKSLQASERVRLANIEKLKASGKGLRGAQLTAHRMLMAEKTAELQMIQSQISATQQLKAVTLGGMSSVTGSAANKARNAKMGSRIGKREAVATNMMASSGIVGQFKIAGKAVRNMSGDVSKAAGVFGKLGTAAKVGAAGLRLFGAAALNAIPIVGQVLFAATLLYEGLTAVFGDPFAKNAIEQAAEDSVTALQKMKEAGDDITQAMQQAANATEAMFVKLNARSGFAGQVATELRSLASTATEGRAEKIQQAQDALDNAGQGSGLVRLFTESDDRKEARRRIMERGGTAQEARAGQSDEIKVMRQEALKAAKDFENMFDSSNVTDALDAAKTSLIDMGFSEASPLLKTINAEMAKIPENSKLSAEQIQAIAEAVEDAEKGTKVFVESFNELPDAINQLQGEFAKLSRKVKTPFTDLAAAGDRVEGTFLTIQKEFNALTEEERGTFNILDRLNAMGDASKEFVSVLKGSDIYKGLAEGVSETEKLTIAAVAYSDAIDKADDLARKLVSDLEKNKTLQKDLGQFASKNAVFMEAQMEAEAEALRIRKRANEAIIASFAGMKLTVDQQAYLNGLKEQNEATQGEIDRILGDELRKSTALFNESKRQLDLENKILGVKRKTFELSQQEQKLDNSSELRQLQRNPFFEILDQGRTAIDQEIKQVEAKLKFEKDNQETINAAKTAMIQAEYALLDAQLRGEMEKLRIRSTDMSEGVTQASRDQAATSANNLETLIGAESGGGTLGAAQTQSVANVAAESEVAVGSLQDKLMGLRESKRDLMDVNVLASGVATSLESNMTGALTALIQGTKSAKEAFADMAKSIIADIAAMIAKQLVFNALKSMFGGFLPFAEGGVAQGGFTAMAKGGYAPGGFRAFADGGTVNKPTLGLVGEGRYNEAIVPLPDGRSIPVEMKSGGGQQNNVTVNVAIDQNGQASSSTNADGNQGKEIGNMVAAAVQQELQHQKRAGGILNPYGNA